MKIMKQSKQLGTQSLLISLKQSIKFNPDNEMVEERLNKLIEKGFLWKVDE